MEQRNVEPGYHPIADYALIGDCHASALINRNGAVDWACLLHLAGSAGFARILDKAKGGYWAIRPREGFTVSRRYLENSMVLETNFATQSGKARLLDFFAMRRGGRTDPYRQLIRIVEGLEGEVEFEFILEPRFDYGTLRPWIRHHQRQSIYSAVGGAEAMVLSQTCELKVDEDAISIRGRFLTQTGQRERFGLVSSLSHEIDHTGTSPSELDKRLDETVAWWQAWAARGGYEGNYQEPVMRSALVLKLLTNAPTGAIIAAPTTSLPESIGSSRNWDYRYCWLRDASLAMSALYVIGHEEIADDFKAFIERATAGRAEDVRIMYGPFGERRLTESELELRGYEGSRPVRIGNAAHCQPQHDVYGELLSAAHIWRKAGHPIPEDEWNFLRGLVDRACEVWRESDYGIWEVRNGPHHFVHSKVMCWVAIEHGLNIADEQSLPCDRSFWLSNQAAIRDEIEVHGVDHDRGCYVQRYGSKELDASLLRLGYVGFIDPDTARMKATVKAVAEDLMTDCFVERYNPYRAPDGCAGSEGSFLICSFWYVDALLLEGRFDEAESIFQRLLKVSNDLDLFSEQYDRQAGVLLGNFPQAYTHIAVINTAYLLWLAKTEDLQRVQEAVKGRFKAFARALKRGGGHERQAGVHED